MENIILNRRSIRKFLNKEISIELIEKMIEAGQMAPSAKNNQPWRYIVFENKEKEKFLDCMEKGIKREETTKSYMQKKRQGIIFAKNTLKIMREAPVVIIALNINAKDPFSPIDGSERALEIMDTLSIGASIENMLLRAKKMGLGTLWIGSTFYAYEELAEYLGVEAQIVAAIAVGYTDEIPPQPPRKNMKEIVEYRL